MNGFVLFYHTLLYFRIRKTADEDWVLIFSRSRADFRLGNATRDQATFRQREIRSADQPSEFQPCNSITWNIALRWGSAQTTKSGPNHWNSIGIYQTDRGTRCRYTDRVLNRMLIWLLFCFQMERKEQALKELKGEVADLKEQYQQSQNKVRKSATTVN